MLKGCENPYETRHQINIRFVLWSNDRMMPKHEMLFRFDTIQMEMLSLVPGELFSIFEYLALMCVAIQPFSSHSLIEQFSMYPK